MEASTRPGRLLRLKNPLLAHMHFLRRLPTAWWWGLQVKTVEPSHAEVVVPYSWRTKNPFRSIYFAALVGAGELATGLLALRALEGQVPVSMWVVRQEAEFVRKAVTSVVFSCTQGREVARAIHQAINGDKAQTIRMMATGRDQKGEVVASVWITWYFKKKA